MLDGPSKAAMGITAYVLIVFAKACELGLGGAITLADVRGPTLAIVCAPCGLARALQRGTSHSRVWGRDADRLGYDPRRLRQGALGQRPRPMQGGVRGALAGSGPARPVELRQHGGLGG